MNKFLFFLFFISIRAMALECYLDKQGGSALENVPIGQLVVLNSLPNGTVLWRSNTISRKVSCSSGTNEDVSLYFNPLKDNLGNGLDLGIVYNGVDLGVVATQVFSGIHVPGHMEVVDKVISFSLYLKKKGVVTTPTIDKYTLVQFDGKLGLNPDTGKNYRILVSGLKDVRVSNCIIDIDLPSVIDFGSLPAWNSVGVNVSSKALPITLTKKGCPITEALGVDASFVTASLLGNDTVDLLNGAGVKIMNPKTNKYIKFNELFDFGNLNSSNILSNNLTMDLISTSATAKAGPFSSSIVFQLNYK